MATPPDSPGSGATPFPHGPDSTENGKKASTGELRFRRYRVIRELGRGGMGVVLLAHDTELDIPVAMKLVPDLVVNDTEAIVDLRKEVLRGMALMHPGIVRTHTFDRDEQGAGIVMEYVDGYTLTDLKLKQPGGCFEPEQILPWLEQLCAVLEYAHDQARIVHRDLKPRNLMLTKEGRLKVADFGIAAVLSDSLSRHSMEGKVSGTLSYMSPQQAEGKRPSPLDDIHAVGATIYELLTGKPPFFRGNPSTILAQIHASIPPTMNERRTELGVADRAELPPLWEGVVADCLAKEPGRRPQSARALLERLRNPGLVPAPAPAPPPPPPPPPQQRTSFPVGIVVAIALFLIIGVGVAGWWFMRPTEGPSASAPLLPVSLGTPTPAPVQRLLAEARTLRQNEAYLLARDRLQAALALDPQNPEVLAELTLVGRALTAATPTPAPEPVPATPPPPATPPLVQPQSSAPAASVALIRRITGSSTLAPQVDNGGSSNSYGAKNAIDGRISTAWVAARGASDVSLRIDFDREVTVSRFSIFPGYGKDADAFAKNNRVKAFVLEFPGGRTSSFRCADRRETQSYNLPDPIATNTLTVRVTEVYRGGKFDRDTPISEVGF